MGEEVSLCGLRRLLRQRPKLPDRLIVTEIRNLPINDLSGGDKALAFLVPLLDNPGMTQTVKHAVALKSCTIYEDHDCWFKDRMEYIKGLLQWLSCRGNLILTTKGDAVWKFLASVWGQPNINLSLVGVDRSLVAQAIVMQRKYFMMGMLLPSADHQMFFFIFHLWKAITTDEQGRRRTFLEASKDGSITPAVGEWIGLCAHVLNHSRITEVLNTPRSKLARVDRMFRSLFPLPIRGE